MQVAQPGRAGEGAVRGNPAGPLPDAERTAGLDAADVHSIRTHPELREAIRSLFLTLTAQQADEGLRRFVIGDKARRLAFWTALALDAEPRVGRSADSPAHPHAAGLTVNRFCDHLTLRGDMSRGRARAIFLFMRHSGMLARVGAQERGKPVRYRPTERMTALLRERMSAALGALGRVSPAGAEALARLQDPVFITHLVAAARQSVVDGTRPLYGIPALVPFLRRDGGEYVAMHLYLAHLGAVAAARAAGGPVRPFPFNITRTAAATHVSRPHVSALMREAAAAGLIVREGDLVCLQPAFEEGVLDGLAATFALLASVAADALASAPHAPS